AGRPGGGRRVLRQPPAGLAARRLGEPPVAAGGLPRGAGGGVRPGGRTVRRAPGSDAAVLGRAAGVAAVGRVLAGAGRPDARPAAVPQAGAGRLGGGAARALTGRPTRAFADNREDGGMEFADVVRRRRMVRTYD